MHHIVEQAYVIELVKLGECLDCASPDEIFDEFQQGYYSNESYIWLNREIIEERLNYQMAILEEDRDEIAIKVYTQILEKMDEGELPNEFYLLIDW